jgi:AbrB family looped-hinge helix DNA binding protein
MQTTIDKAGRVVIPSAIRAMAGLRQGSVLDVVFEDNQIRLRPDLSRAHLVRRRGRLIAEATAPKSDLPPVDVAKLVDEERDRWPT